MKKLALIAICVLALGAGCAKNQPEKNSAVQNVEEKNTIVGESTAASTTMVDNATTTPPVATTQSGTTNKNPSPAPTGKATKPTIAESLCRDKQSLGLAGYDDGVILKCGEYFKVIPPDNLEDAPDVMFANTGKIVARCGGMPGPEPQELPAVCSISCTKTGLFLCAK